MKYPAFHFLVFLTAFLISSCQKDQTGNQNNSDPAVQVDREIAVYRNAKSNETNNNETLRFGSALNILMPGLYHGEDISEKARGMTWYGIYRASNGSELREAEVIFEPAFDPVLDNEGEMSALNIIEMADTASAVFLIAGTHADRPVAIGSTHPDGIQWPVTLEPGSKVTVGEYCRLDASGTGMTDYRIDFIVEHNKIQGQTIASAEALDDTYMSIHWCGDLNGDGIPDLLLNISPKYSYSHMALFMSDAESGDELTKVAEFIFTAC